MTPLSPQQRIGKYRFSIPLLESSASRAGLLGSAPPDRLPKSLRGAGFTASQARFLRLLARARFLQRFSRFRFPNFLQWIYEHRFTSALLDAASRVRFSNCASRAVFSQVLAGMGGRCLSSLLLESAFRVRSLKSPPSTPPSQDLAVDGCVVVEDCLCSEAFLNSLATRGKPDGRNLHACVASAAFGFGRCYVCVCCVISVFGYFLNVKDDGHMRV